MTPAVPEPDADRLAEAVRAVPCVHDLASAPATHLVGRRVRGVRVDDDVVQVGVLVRLGGEPVPVLAEQVRAAVAPLAGGRRVDVVVADAVVPEGAGAHPLSPPYPEARELEAGR